MRVGLAPLGLGAAGAALVLSVVCGVLVRAGEGARALQLAEVVGQATCVCLVACTALRAAFGRAAWAGRLVWPLGLGGMALVTLLNLPRAVPSNTRLAQPYSAQLQALEQGAPCAAETLIERSLHEAAAPAALQQLCKLLPRRPNRCAAARRQMAERICRTLQTGCAPDALPADGALMRLCGHIALHRGARPQGEALLAQAAARGDRYACAIARVHRAACQRHELPQQRYVTDGLTDPMLSGLRPFGAPGALRVVPAPSPTGLALWLSGQSLPLLRSAAMPASWRAARLWLRFGAGGGSVVYRDAQARILATYRCGAGLPAQVCGAQGGFFVLPMAEPGGFVELVGPLLVSQLSDELRDG